MKNYVATRNVNFTLDTVTEHLDEHVVEQVVINVEPSSSDSSESEDSVESDGFLWDGELSGVEKLDQPGQSVMVDGSSGKIYIVLLIFCNFLIFLPSKYFSNVFNHRYLKVCNIYYYNIGGMSNCNCCVLAISALSISHENYPAAAPLPRVYYKLDLSCHFVHISVHL